MQGFRTALIGALNETSQTISSMALTNCHACNSISYLLVDRHSNGLIQGVYPFISKGSM